MARPSLTTDDYIEEGELKGLQFIGINGIAPYSVYDKTFWECRYCGHRYLKTWRAVHLGEFGCRCQNSMTFKDEDYNKLAERLGITWLGPRPINVNGVTKWQSRGGIIIEATYKSLAYRPAQELLTKLEVV
jgi:hypothetical protein